MTKTMPRPPTISTPLHLVIVRASSRKTQRQRPARRRAAVVKVSSIDHDLARCVDGSYSAPIHCEAALVALNQLVEEFLPPELELDFTQAYFWVNQMTEYLL